MAPSAKKSAKANVDTSKHDILSFFGSAQSRGATSSSKSEGKPKEALTPKETPKETKTKAKTKTKIKTKVESEDSEDGEPKSKFKCATFEALHANAELTLYSSWAAAKAARLAGPSNPGSKAVPPAAVPDCLAGLSFVFTGELSSFSRDEAVDIAKRFCGWGTLLNIFHRNSRSRYSSRVVGQPSSKTDYVVLGDNAGPSKLAALKKHKLKTLSEDEFLNLIATRKGPGNGKGLSEKEKKKKDKEEKAIRDSAKEMEAREKAIEASGSGAARGCVGALLLGNRIDTATGSRQ